MLNRTFCEGDNLEFLLRMPDESVDLIATDPPFNKNKEFQGIGAAEGAKFKDYWAWDSDEDVHPAYLAHVREHWSALHEVIEAAYAAHSPSMAAFLAFMSVRLIEMHRILKPTGSLYLHCDPTANAYLRLMLDSVFGRDNFRNEVVWNLETASGYKSQKAGYIRGHDTILYYVKDAGFTFNKQFLPHKPEYVARFRKVGEGGRLYRDDRGGRRQYLDETPGVALTDVWSDIMSFQQHSTAPERTGYPTQKPLPLYRRMIEASSDKGDLVLDPFAGCATTCVAAEQLGRHWIGIDLSPLAQGITLDRLRKEAGRGSFWEKNVRVLTVKDLRPLPKGTTAALSIPLLPERLQRGLPRGYKPENVRRYLAARDAAGLRKSEAGNIACQGCGFAPPRLDYLEVDHITPQAKQGANIWSNFCLLCPPCNKRKAHKLSVDELRAAVRADGDMLDESKLVPMDAEAMAKRDRAFRPLQ